MIARYGFSTSAIGTPRAVTVGNASENASTPATEKTTIRIVSEID